MKRPSFQFYPGDWTGNSNLRRCTHAEKGAWLDIMCLMHDQEEYGVLRWPLKEIALAAGCPIALVKALVSKGVLKGDDAELSEPFVYTPRSGRKNGDPVDLITTQAGPIWYSSRMVKDEYVRTIRGEGLRFGDGNDAAPKVAPKKPSKASPKPPFGDGSSSSSSSSPSGKDNPPNPPAGGEGWSLPDWVPAEPWRQFEEMRRKKKKPMTDAARKLAVTKLDALRGAGHDVGIMLDQSILHAWDTFYPPKMNDGPAQGTFGNDQPWTGAV